MLLAKAELIGVAPLGDMSLSFRGDDALPRPLTVIHGSGGVGKTALLHVLACTRPGNTMALIGRTPPGASHSAHAQCEWVLGDDDTDRPHPLITATPSTVRGRDDDVGLIQRREQSLFDRRAKAGRGFVFVTISSARWFSRQAISLSNPLRSVAHYDVKATASFDDAAHSDLTRATKQSLAYAAISSALVPQTQKDRNRLKQRSDRPWDTRVLGNAMRETVDKLTSLVGFRYEGLDPTSFEPQFTGPGGRTLIFDRLPNRVRDLAAIGALPLRALWASYPDMDPRTAEGVIAIDELDRNQDDQVRTKILPILRQSFPRVQWIVTTTSPVLAASVDASSVVAFRREPQSAQIELYTGADARLH